MMFPCKQNVLQNTTGPKFIVFQILDDVNIKFVKKSLYFEMFSIRDETAQSLTIEPTLGFFLQKMQMKFQNQKKN